MYIPVSKIRLVFFCDKKLFGLDSHVLCKVEFQKSVWFSNVMQDRAVHRMALKAEPLQLLLEASCTQRAGEHSSDHAFWIRS